MVYLGTKQPNSPTKKLYFTHLKEHPHAPLPWAAAGGRLLSHVGSAVVVEHSAVDELQVSWNDGVSVGVGAVYVLQVSGTGVLCNLRWLRLIVQ